MNITEAKARLYDIDRRLKVLMDAVLNTAVKLKEAVLENKCVTAPDFEVYNAGLLIEKVALISKEGQIAMDEFKTLSKEKEGLQLYLMQIEGGGEL